jgi:hypothetical protein
MCVCTLSTLSGDDSFVTAVVSTVHKVSAERGANTEETLCHRYAKVNMVARRVAIYCWRTAIVTTHMKV